MKKQIALVALLAVLSALSVPVGAQSDQLDLEGGPNYLSAVLPGYPDPIIVTLLSGGEVDAGSLDLGSGCIGNVFPSADVSVALESRQAVLRVYFTASNVGDDTTLVVRAPDGSFFCNDDFDGSNPMVEIANAAEGEYRIWVGSFGSTENYAGYLVATTGESMPGALASALLGTTGATASIAPAATQDPMAMIAPTLTAAAAAVNAAVVTQDPMAMIAPTLTAAAAAVNAAAATQDPMAMIAPTLTAAMATVNAMSASLLATPTPVPVQNAGAPSLLTLAAGFSPDPTSLPLSLGVGSVDARQMFGGDCRGTINPLPAVVLSYTGGGALLRLFFTSSEDTTMIVQQPDGRFACGDDYPGTTNPLVDISQPQAGVYSVWLGTYSAGMSAQGTLYIAGSEASDPTTVSSGK